LSQARVPPIHAGQVVELSAVFQSILFVRGKCYGSKVDGRNSQDLVQNLKTMKTQTAKTTKMYFEIVAVEQTAMTKIQSKLNKWWTDGTLRKYKITPISETQVLFECILNKTGE